MQHHPLACRRINRASADIVQYIQDLALASNQDGMGHVIGNADDVYAKTLAKLELAMYKYLYIGWNAEEYQMVIGDQ